MDPSKIFPGSRNTSGFVASEFFRSPVTILRVISIILSIVVFGAVSSGCHTVEHVCIFDGIAGVCNYATGIGVIAFLGALALLVGDGMFNSISNIKRRRQVIIGDLAFSGLWTFLWFVSFCLLTNKWTVTSSKWLKEHKVEGWQENNARSAIVFSLLSLGVWGGITFFALQRFRVGQAGIGTGEGETAIPSAGGDGPSMPGYGGIPDQGGHQPMGTGAPAPPQPMGGGGQYYTPTY